ncbi:unnamed protein product, partial [Protopolystoma xenopodis]
MLLPLVLEIIDKAVEREELCDQKISLLKKQVAEAEQRAAEADRQVSKLQNEVDRLEGGGTCCILCTAIMLMLPYMHMSLSRQRMNRILRYHIFGVLEDCIRRLDSPSRKFLAACFTLHTPARAWPPSLPPFFRPLVRVCMFCLRRGCAGSCMPHCVRSQSAADTPLMPPFSTHPPFTMPPTDELLAEKVRYKELSGRVHCRPADESAEDCARVCLRPPAPPHAYTCTVPQFLFSLGPIAILSPHSIIHLSVIPPPPTCTQAALPYRCRTVSSCSLCPSGSLMTFGFSTRSPHLPILTRPLSHLSARLAPPWAVGSGHGSDTISPHPHVSPRPIGQPAPPTHA